MKRIVSIILSLGACLALGNTSAPQEESVTQRIERLRREWVTRSNAFRFGKITQPENAKVFQKHEIAFELEGSWDNPFDPDDIRVDAAVRRPDGKILNLPAFYSVGYDSKDGKTRLTAGLNYVPTGQKGWRFRYTPTLPGKYGLRLVATDRSGRKAESPALAFQAVPAPGKGFVRISPRNPEFFENTGDGTLFWPCGSNIPWTRHEDPGEATYNYYFARAAGNMNATRIWLCHYAWLEWCPASSKPANNGWSQWQGLTIFNQMIAGEVDRIFAMAEKQGLRIMLVTEDNDEMFASGSACNWAYNPYNIANNGFAAKPDELWTHPGAIKAYQKRLRYILARWGYSTSLWTINAWNDMHDTQPRHAAWIKAMRDYVHAVAGDSRPVIYGANFGPGSEKSKDYFTSFTGHVPGMPNVEQECYFLDDHFEATTLDSIYQGMCKRLAGVMVWGHVPTERLGCWNLYRAPMQFAQTMRFNEKTWRPQKVDILSAEGELPDDARRIITARAYGDVPNWGAKSETSCFKIDFADSTDGHLLRGLNPKLYGKRQSRAVWRTPVTFDWDYPHGGEFVVNANEYGSGDNILAITLDSAKTVTTPYHNGRRELTGSDRFTTVHVPPGRHTLAVDVENAGSDWISVHEYLFLLKVKNPRQLLLANGLASRDSGFLYLVNSSYSVLNPVFGIKGEVPLRNVRLALPDIPAGRYTVDAIHPATGKLVSSQKIASANNRLQLSLPDIEAQMLVRWIRENN